MILLLLSSAMLAGCGGTGTSENASENASEGSKAPASQHSEDELAIVASGGAMEAALKTYFYDPFAKESGVRVVPVAANVNDQWAKAKIMADTGNVQWDLVTVTGGDEIIFRDLLEPMPCDQLKNVQLYGIAEACGDNYLKRTIGGSVLAYDADVFPEGKRPQSWKDFWNVKDFPGPRALPDHGQPWEVLAVALMADGVQPASLFPMDLDRAFRKLDEIKPYVSVWWKTGAQSQQILRDKEVVMSMMWSGQGINMQNQGANIGLEWNQAVKVIAMWGILKHAPHPNAAQSFLDFFLSHPESHQAFSEEMGYDTANKQALNGLSEAELKQKATYEPNWSRMVTVSENPWVTENREAIWERWSEWLAG